LSTKYPASDAAFAFQPALRAQSILKTAFSSQGESSPKIVAFIEKKTAYGAADLGGQNRRAYPTEMRIIGVPSAGRLGIKHLLHAFANGADGVLLIEGDDSMFKEDKLRERVIQMKKELAKAGVESLRIQSITTTLPQYEKIFALFDSFTERIKKMGPVKSEKRETLKKQIVGEIIAK
jgi:coenzyme F420-reducing hydrogenase delta subunit